MHYIYIQPHDKGESITLDKNMQLTVTHRPVFTYIFVSFKDSTNLIMTLTFKQQPKLSSTRTCSSFKKKKEKKEIKLILGLSILNQDQTYKRTLILIRSRFFVSFSW